jgi:EpsI family protein
MVENRRFLFALATLAIGIVMVFTLSQRGVPVVLQTNLENIPLEISGYQGSEDVFPPWVYETLNADQHIYRHYRSPEGKQVSLYIGYYGTAKGGRSSHNPYGCLPSVGWAIVERGSVEISPSYQSQGVRVNYVLASKDDIQNVMLHWYQSAGTRVLSTGIQQNLQRFIGRVLHNRNDGAYVQVNTFVREQDIPEAREIVHEFARDIMEFLPKHWPEETI